MGIVNDDTGNCTELFNNSLFVGRMIVSTICGPRCAGRNGQIANWTKPSSSQLNARGPLDHSSYSDLTSRSNSFNSDDRGIYTCSVNNGSYVLHIGLYEESPGTTRY